MALLLILALGIGTYPDQSLIFFLSNSKLLLVQVHGIAALLSFINILRAASMYNERKTFTLLFVMVGYPFLLFTVLSRILAAAVIVTFLDAVWIIVLILG